MRRRRRSPQGEAQDLTEASDNQLLVIALTDPEAFGVFFDRHYDDVLRFFVVRVRSPDTAADLCAETLAAALDGLANFDPGRGLGRQWLYGIARNKLSRYWRDLRVSTEARDRLGIVSLLVDDESVVALAKVEANVDSGALFSALDRLPPDQAVAVRLRVVEELGYGEIADRLKVQEGAIRVRVHRGLRRLELEFGGE